MNSPSNFSRLLAVALVVLAGVAAFIFNQASERDRREHLREFHENARRTLSILEWLLSERSGGQSYHLAASELSRHFGVRITYVSGGKVLAESDLKPAAAEAMEDHSTRPEIVEALKSGFGTSDRYSTTVKARLTYVAKKVTGIPGMPDGVLRIAVPESRVAAALNESRRDYMMVVGAMALCAAIVCALLLLRMREVLGSFTRSVQDMALQDLPDKIRVSPGSEYRPLMEAVNMVAKRARKSIRRLQETRSQLDAVLERMTDAVVVLDQKGVIIMHNPALAPLVKCPSGTIEGCNVLDAGFGPAVFGEVQQALSTSEPVQRRFQARLTAGGYADVDLIGYLTGRGKRRVILVLHDVTAMRQAGDVLREFVIDASHRLRTPLTSIQGYAATLLESPPEDEALAKSMLGTILTRSKEMGGVVTSLLDKASPQAEASPEPTDKQ